MGVWRTGGGESPRLLVLFATLRMVKCKLFRFQTLRQYPRDIPDDQHQQQIESQAGANIIHHLLGLSSAASRPNHGSAARR